MTDQYNTAPQTSPNILVSSSINRIPPELLGEIFKHYINEVPQSRRKDLCTSTVTSGHLTTVNPIVLGHVCASWRALSVSMNTLWSSLAVYRPKPSHLPLIQLWLERSGSCPLTLSLSHAVDGDRYQHVATEHILSQYIRLAQRWKSIRLSLFDSKPYRPLLNLSSGSTAILESAQLDLPDWDHADVDKLWSILHSSPSLRRVSWGSECNFTELPSHIPWAQLTHISSKSLITASSADLLFALRPCRDLVELSLSTSWPECGSINMHTPALLPNLRFLKIYSEGGNPAQLLGQLTLPSLASLQIYHSSFSCNSTGFTESVRKPCSYLFEFLCRSKCPLSQLMVSDESLSIQDVKGLFTSPMMKTLRMIKLTVNAACAVLNDCDMA